MRKNGEKSESLKKYYIFSYGMNPRQVTLEVLIAMRECDIIFSPSARRRAAKFLSKFAGGVRIVSCLTPMIAERLALRALTRYNTVGYLIFGNPFFYTKDGLAVCAAAKKMGAETKIFAGVSSFDELVVKFKMAGYLKGDIRIGSGELASPDPRADFFCFCAPELFNMEPSRRARALQVFAGAYPKGSPVFLARCRPGRAGDDSVEIIKGAVSQLPQLFKRAGIFYTVFIPAVNGARGNGKRSFAKG